MSIKHSFTSTKSEGGDATLVGANEWNASHVGFNVADSNGNSVTNVSEIRFGTGYLVDLGSGIVKIFSSAGDVVALGSYGDECDTVTPNASWTLRNISSGDFTGNGSGYSILFDAQGDAVTKSFTDPAANFELLAHITGLVDAGGMIGLCALDSAGSGIAYSPYNDGKTYVWAITTYNYASTGPSTALEPNLGDFWIHLRRVSNAWSGRYSNDGTNWSAFTSTSADSRTITQIGLLRAYTGGGNQTIRLQRFVYGTPSITFP